MKTTLHPDKIRVNGPKVDGSYTLSFDIGEYERLEVAKLIALPPEAEVTLEVIANG